MVRMWRVKWVAAGVVLLLGLAGAVWAMDHYLFRKPHILHTRTRDEAGHVSVSVVSVARWQDVKETLKPNFNLSPANALDLAVPVTSSLSAAYMRALTGGLSLGVPSDGGDGGDPPAGDSGQAAQPGQPATRAPDLSRVKANPFMTHQTAMSLMHEVNLLNAMVDNVARKNEEDAYVVRLRVGVVPYLRDLPYDVYSRVSFFLTPQHRLNENVRALAFLASDNMEGMDSNQVLDQLHQFNLSLKAQGQGGGLGASDGKERAAAATEYHSVLSITGLSANSLQARFGATRNGSDGYSMQERSQYVTALVFVPRHQGYAVEKPPKLEVVAQYELRDAATGRFVPEPTIQKWFQSVREALGELPDLNAGGALGKDALITVLEKEVNTERRHKEKSPGSAEPRTCRWDSVKALHEKGLGGVSLETALYFDLTGMVRSNDSFCFENTIRATNWSSYDWRVLWTRFAASVAVSNLSIDIVDLPGSGCAPSLGEGEAVVALVDDGSRLAGMVAGMRCLRPDNTQAWLELGNRRNARLPGSVLSDEATGTTSLAFPSLAALGLGADERVSVQLHLHGNPGAKIKTRALNAVILRKSK